MTFKTEFVLCWIAVGAAALSGCMLPPLAPVTDIVRADNSEPAEASPRRTDVPRGQIGRDFHEQLPADERFGDPAMTAARPSEPKSLGNMLVALETLKRDSPEDYIKLKQLLDNTPETIPPQFQQTFQNQLLAIAAEQSHPLPSAPIATVQAPNALTPLVPPANSVAMRDDVSPQPADLQVPNTRSSNVSTQVGSALLADATEDANQAAHASAATQHEYRPGLWRDDIAGALEALEVELIRGKHDREAKARLESYRRLLHVVANHPEDAVVPIEELDADEQEFWKHQLHSLLIALDADDKHAASRQAALALRDLRTASHHLANISTLDLRNTTFCTKVNSYGEFTEFESYSFRPGEEVVLYVEIDNFATHPKGDQFETELHGSYQILDEAGRRVANVVLQIDRQVSNNRRRDYFIPYLITMPAKIAPGSYRLQLTIEDVIGKKSNYASIDFRIR